MSSSELVTISSTKGKKWEKKETENKKNHRNICTFEWKNFVWRNRYFWFSHYSVSIKISSSFHINFHSNEKYWISLQFEFYQY